jgi:predicted enzyme related to lactoylglutathione lyase
MRVGLLATLCVVMVDGAAGQRPPTVDYRPVMTLQLGVTNLDRSIRFYEGTLGFTVRERRDDLKFAHVTTNVPGLELGLNEVERATPSATIIANFSVVDAAAARHTLEAKGVSFSGPTQVIPGKVALAAFTDPDGYRLRLAGPAPAR